MTLADSSTDEAAIDASAAPYARAGDTASVAQSQALHAPMVLHVRVVTGHGGGPEKTILNSPRFLTRLGYQSKLAYLHPPEDVGIDALIARGKTLDAEVLSVPDRGPLDLSVIRRLARLCKEHRVALWHAHDYKSNLLGLLIRPFHRMQLVTTLHGWTNMSGRMPLYAGIDKRCLKYYQATICVSPDLLEECRRWRVPRDRCHLIYNAIDTDEYSRQSAVAEAKAKLRAPADGVLIGAVGRLSPEKGFDNLIRAVADVRASGVNVSLWIAGDGDARGDLTKLIDQFGCRDHIKLLGHVADPRPLYEAMDFYVLSSLREGLPNVILEAMAMKTPVLATGVAGVPALIEDGDSGLIIEPGNAGDLVAGIARLAGDPALRERLARVGRLRVEARFSFFQRMEKVADIYNGLLGRR